MIWQKINSSIMCFMSQNFYLGPPRGVIILKTINILNVFIRKINKWLKCLKYITDDLLCKTIIRTISKVAKFWNVTRIAD